jgi:transcriptional regulator with XRE-family HTH domain
VPNLAFCKPATKLSERIQKARKKLDMSQQAFAELCGWKTPTASSRICQIERFVQTTIGEDGLKKLSKGLGVSVNTIRKDAAIVLPGGKVYERPSEAGVKRKHKKKSGGKKDHPFEIDPENAEAIEMVRRRKWPEGEGLADAPKQTSHPSSTGEVTVTLPRGFLRSLMILMIDEPEIYDGNEKTFHNLVEVYFG